MDLKYITDNIKLRIEYTANYIVILVFNLYVHSRFFFFQIHDASDSWPKTSPDNSRFDLSCKHPSCPGDFCHWLGDTMRSRGIPHL